MTYTARGQRASERPAGWLASQLAARLRARKEEAQVNAKW